MSLNLETVRFVKCYLWLVEYNDAGTLKRTLNDQNSGYNCTSSFCFFISNGYGDNVVSCFNVYSDANFHCFSHFP